MPKHPKRQAGRVALNRCVKNFESFGVLALDHLALDQQPRPTFVPDPFVDFSGGDLLGFSVLTGPIQLQGGRVVSSGQQLPTGDKSQDNRSKQRRPSRCKVEWAKRSSGNVVNSGKYPATSTAAILAWNAHWMWTSLRMQQIPPIATIPTSGDFAIATAPDHGEVTLLLQFPLQKRKTATFHAKAIQCPLSELRA